MITQLGRDPLYSYKNTFTKQVLVAPDECLPKFSKDERKTEGGTRAYVILSSLQTMYRSLQHNFTAPTSPDFEAHRQSGIPFMFLLAAGKTPRAEQNVTPITWYQILLVITRHLYFSIQRRECLSHGIGLAPRVLYPPILPLRHCTSRSVAQIESSLVPSACGIGAAHSTLLRALVGLSLYFVLLAACKTCCTSTHMFLRRRKSPLIQKWGSFEVSQRELVQT